MFRSNNYSSSEQVCNPLHTAIENSDYEGLLELLNDPELSVFKKNKKGIMAHELAIKQHKYLYAARIYLSNSQRPMGALIYPSLTDLVDDLVKYIDLRSQEPNANSTLGWLFRSTKTNKIHAAAKLICQIYAQDIKSFGFIGYRNTLRIGTGRLARMTDASASRCFSEWLIEESTHQKLNQLEALKTLLAADSEEDVFDELVKLNNQSRIEEVEALLEGSEFLQEFIKAAMTPGDLFFSPTMTEKLRDGIESKFPILSQASEITNAVNI